MTAPKPSSVASELMMEDCQLCRLKRVKTPATHRVTRRYANGESTSSERCAACVLVAVTSSAADLVPDPQYPALLLSGFEVTSL